MVTEKIIKNWDDNEDIAKSKTSDEYFEWLSRNKVIIIDIKKLSSKPWGSLRYHSTYIIKYKY
jgi:hypothetical protein